MTPLHKQAGMTAIGMVLTVMLVGFVALMCFRIIPMYIDHFTIVGSLQSLERDPEVVGMNAAQLRSRLQRRFDVNSIDAVKSRDVQIKRVNGGKSVAVKYDATSPLFANLEVIAHFESSVVIPNP